LSEATNEAVIERFYHELWNRWNLTVADEIVSEDVRFRGSTLEGRESFKGYVETVRAAFTPVGCASIRCVRCAKHSLAVCTAPSR
jgi:hypothetical protein